MALGQRSGSSRSCGAVLGMLGQVPQGGPDGRPGGVDAGHEHQVAGAEDVVVGHRLAVDLGLDELGDEVVLARVGPPIGQLLGEEVEQRGAGFDALHGLEVALLEDGAHPADELVGPRVVDAEHGRDHSHGDLLGVVAGHVGPALRRRSRR